ncbi:MAG: response regulator transcription factor [Chloroflexi bacterium]|nr:response regulator transcription factor [Chloroflexota bacterium]
MRVLVVDDHPLVRDGLASLLKLRGYDVAGAAANGVQAVELARALRPDLILMDIAMPEMDGLQATRLITAENPEARVVMLTVSDNDDALFEAIKAGARGYVLKSTETESFFQMLTGVARGEEPISGSLARRILGEFATNRRDGRAQRDDEPLTAREILVLEHVAEGLTNRDIAERMALSENTIKYYLKNILQKLHMHNRAQAAAFAVQSGILHPRPP